LIRYAFFIEEKEAVAERVGGMMLDVPQVHQTKLSTDASARLALFQYMVGNTDWDMVYFHNVTLMRGGDGIYIPMPYDFAFTGLVAASYAKPDEQLGLRTIKDRMYRGFCRPEVDFSAMYSELNEYRPRSKRSTRGWKGSRRRKRRVPSSTWTASTTSSLLRGAPNWASKRHAEGFSRMDYPAQSGPASLRP